MKMAEIYRAGKMALSFEVFPPKTPQGLELLYRVVDELRSYQPGFISCTYGAGGSTRDQTLEIVTTIQQRFGVTATAHFTCVGSTVEELRAWLRRATAAGVQNIMALRGDPPQGRDRFEPVPGGLTYANELIELIRREFDHFGIGAAGYPETHQEAPSFEADLLHLKRKVDAGADAVFTQLFYDNDDFLRFRDRCSALGITVPIIPGLLPILSFAQIRRITTLCKAKLPEELMEKLERCGDDLSAQAQVGIEHATTQTENLLRAGVPGIHFYVLNKSESIQKILGNVASLLPRWNGT